MHLTLVYNLLCFQISTSAGWSDAFEAISWEDQSDCEIANEDTGFEGTCGQFGLGAAYMLLYLTLSFLIIVNMYIAVILENYSQVIQLYHLIIIEILMFAVFIAITCGL